MRVTKVVLGLAGLLLMSLVFVSFQAAAHPEASEGGIKNARAEAQAGTDPPAYGLTKAFGLFSEEWWSAMDTQIAHNPLCSGHPLPGHA